MYGHKRNTPVLWNFVSYQTISLFHLRLEHILIKTYFCETKWFGKPIEVAKITFFRVLEGNLTVF